ncbi:MAG TPA: hypothetical protein VFV02_14600 [Acidimicrobiales bacterium]|nr:hypothetical protein [Acidimicrobiales bacterium]
MNVRQRLVGALSVICMLGAAEVSSAAATASDVVVGRTTRAVAGATPADLELMAAPPWGACGLRTDPNKVVRTFDGTDRRQWVLRCGGPKFSREPGWGYRHILWRHRGDFERMAAGTGQNWRDVADLAMAHIATDPDKWGDAGDGKSCRSRVIFLVNKRTGQVVRQQIVKQISVYKGGRSSDIITAYPSSSQC